MKVKRIIPVLPVIALGFARVVQADPTMVPLAVNDYVISGQVAPLGTPVMDAVGNLYGTTSLGGTNGDGTVFELSGANHQTLTTLATFNGTNGSQPRAGLTIDAAGNLYGTTAFGGAQNEGTAFELSGANHHQTLNTLATFSGSNGANPATNLTLDAAGSLYGTTVYGGTESDGTLFELSGANYQTLTTLVNFNVNVFPPGPGFFPNGMNPYSNLIADAAGNLYGTTIGGGHSSTAAGTVFELSGAQHQTGATLVTFSGTNGANPFGGLTADATGNLYGTTQSGGANNQGSIFELSGSNHQTLTTLWSFSGSNGAHPDGELIADAAGNLYGTTYLGGTDNVGTVFKLSADHQTFTTLWTFDGDIIGANPEAGLIADAVGNLYGTAANGGVNFTNGAVFELTGTGFVVPEPAPLPLLAFGSLSLLRRRRTRAT